MLGMPPAAEGTVIGLRRAANGIRAATTTTTTTTTYLPDQMATDTEPAPPEPAEDSLASALNRVPAVPGHSSRKPGPIPAAAHIEARAPSPGIASQLALKPGLPVVDLAVRFDDPATGRPAALTVAALWRDPSSARPRRRCLAWTRQR